MNIVVLSADRTILRSCCSSEHIFGDIIGIYIVAINFIIVVIARYVTVDILVYCCCCVSSDDAGLELVRQLTSLDATSSSIAEIRAFVNMAFCASRSLLTISVDCKCSANRRIGCNVDMCVGTFCVGAPSFGEVQARWCSLWSKIMRKVARVSMSAQQRESWANDLRNWMMMTMTIRVE